MTLSDMDLEARLRRDLRARGDDVPPAPADLAEATRRRHRTLRRRQLGLVAAGVAAALVLVGVPVISSSLTADSDRGQAARPTGSPYRPGPGNDLYDAPTRGGLADDDAWLRAMAAVEWSPSSPYRDPGMELAEPFPAESRRVVYADDVPSGRVALVVGRSGRKVVHAWFVGPRGAEPGEMTSANFPGLYDTDVVALVDGEASDETLTLVVVADPDAVIERPLLPVVDADGNEAPSVDTLDLENGIAVVEVDRRWAESGPSLNVQLDRASSVGVAISESPRAVPPVQALMPADPRGLARLVEPSPWLQDHAAHLLRQYGLTAQEAEPTLLAAGPVSSRHSAELLGITFPSGATGLWLTTYEPGDPDIGMMGTQLPHAPAGIDLLDRAVAVRTNGGLVVSAPSGVRVDVLDASGVVVESLPLTGGAGTGPLAVPAAAVDFRVVDGAGNVVAEGPIEVID